MNKRNGIYKIRKSISQRNKMRNLKTKKPSTKSVTPVFPQEEEKHGYFPAYLDSPLEKKNEETKRVSGVIVKGILSVVLFFGVGFLLKTESTIFSKPKQWTSYVLAEEFPFARVSHWYQTTFGSPLTFLPGEKSNDHSDELMAMPVSGNVTETFQTNGTGIMISPDKPTPVNTWNDGVVIFAGNDRETNKTVVVQHADNSKSTYGLLSSIDVHLYQFIEANQKIGVTDPAQSDEPVYFSIKKDDKFIDPVQVIKVDDLP